MKKFIVLFLFDVYLFAFSQPNQLAHFIILYNVVYPDARCIVSPFYYYCCCCCVGLSRHVGQQTRKEIVYIRDAIVMIGWTITEILYISWLICLYVWMVWRIMQSKVNQLIRIESYANDHPNDKSEKMYGAHSQISSSVCSRRQYPAFLLS